MYRNSALEKNLKFQAPGRALANNLTSSTLAKEHYCDDSFSSICKKKSLARAILPVTKIPAN